MRWGLGAVVLVACSGEPGVDLDMHVDGVAFDEVVLYIAKDKCDTCDGIGWPGAPRRRLPGDVWLIEGDEKVVSSTVIAGGDGVIHLEAADGFDRARSIAIVAFKGSHLQGEVVAAAVLHDITIPTDRQQRWNVTLEPTDRSVMSTTPPGDGERDKRARAWARESTAQLDASDYTGCLALQAWNGNTWDTEFFVPQTDTDCDGTPPDCDAYFNHAPASAAVCVTRGVDVPLTCVLGHANCTSEMPGTSCGMNTPMQCVPEAFCGPCPSGDVKACMQAAFADPATTTVPYASCQFTIDVINPNTGCNNVPGGESLAFLVPAGCTPPAGVTRIGALRTDPFGQDVPTLGLSGGAKIDVSVHNDGISCTATLTWEPNTSPGSKAAQIYLSVWYTDRQLVIPLNIDFAPGQCGSIGTQSCDRVNAWPDMVQGDTMFDCTR